MKSTLKFTLSTIAICITISTQLWAQNPEHQQQITGTVSYVTSQNIYLRFDNTAVLQIDDTLFISRNGNNQACLILKKKSSVSCMAERIGDCSLKQGDQVTYYYTPKIIETENPEKTDTDSSSVNPGDNIVEQNNKTKNKHRKRSLEDIDGKVSLSNYSTTGIGGINSRSVARVMVDAEHIGNSKFSIYNYAYFRFNSLSDSGEKRTLNRLNIYELNLRYDYDSSLSFSIGRTISRRMYSIGAMDGITAEKQWKNFYTGIVAGFRPDPVNYGLNFNLFQFGAYAGLYHDPSHHNSTNIGFINQTNAGRTDRRYLYVQHRSELGKNVRLFASTEIDLYEKDTANTVTNKLRLTSVYLSVHYRVNSKLRLMASYDVRKNIILYESFASSLDLLTQNDPYRGGLRLRLNYRINRNLYAGISVSNRAQSDGQNNYSNANLYFNISDLPGIGGRLMNTISINRNYSYQYYSLSTRYTKDLANNKISLSPSSRIMVYDYTRFSLAPFIQLYLGLDAYYRISKTWSIGAAYEFSAIRGTNFNRFNTHLIKRF